MERYGVCVDAVCVCVYAGWQVRAVVTVDYIPGIIHVQTDIETGLHISILKVNSLPC